MNNLQKAVENLYSTFNKYSTEGIQYCDCGCINEEDVKKLSSKTLSELEEDHLISYHGSAMYTWGDVEHYKHFLPRICELISINRNFSFVTLYVLQVKLEHAEWRKWSENEQQAIKDYVIADWIDFVNNRNSEIRDSDLEVYSKFLGLQEVLNLWKISNSDEALRNFVYFFYHFGSQILNRGLRILDQKYKSEFLELLYEEGITAKLEFTFFKNEETNPDYAEKISTVLQMIEQEIRISGK